MSKKIPQQIRHRIEHHLTQLLEHARTLQAVHHAHGDGHNLTLEVEKRQGGIKQSYAILDEIREQAKKHQAVAEFHEYVNKLGVPNLTTFGVSSVVVPAWVHVPVAA